MVGIPLWVGPTLLVLIWLDGDSSRAAIGAGIVGVGFSLLCILLFLSGVTTVGQQGSPAALALVRAIGVGYLFAGLAAVGSRPEVPAPTPTPRPTAPVPVPTQTARPMPPVPVPTRTPHPTPTVSQPPHPTPSIP